MNTCACFALSLSTRVKGLTGEAAYPASSPSARRCEELVLRAVGQPPSVETVRTLDDISDAVRQGAGAAETLGGQEQLS